MNSAGAGHAISSAFTGSGEIIVFWLAGCLILGFFVLWTRDETVALHIIIIANTLP